MKKRVSLIIMMLLLFSVSGVVQAQPVAWDFDSAHSRMYFEIRHVFSAVRGGFDEFTGTILIDPKTGLVTRCDLEVAVKSIDTGIQQRDNHLRSKDFFEESAYPVMTFKSGEVTHIGGDRYQLSGRLTIKDVTKDVTAPFTFLGLKDNPLDPKKLIAGYEAEFTIDRLDYHVGSGRFYEMGAVGKDVKIVVTFEVTKDKP